MPPQEPQNRFALIQAMRGIAALWVVLFHMEKGEGLRGLTELLPGFVTTVVFHWGSAGVAVFFVLSGFVIRHSLNDKAMNHRELGTFVVRRSIRLDPPYWASMLLMVAVGFFLAAAKGVPFDPPTGKQVLLHGLYLQELLNVPSIQIVYWTLTYEIQFYLVFALALTLVGMASWLGMRASAAYWLIFGPLIALGFVSAAAGEDWAPRGLFANLWHGFLLGVLAYDAGMLKKSVHTVLLLILCALTGIKGLWSESIFGVPCAAAALMLLVASRTRLILEGLQSSLWQMGGTLSYSLYLVHIPVLRLLTGAWQRIVGRSAIADALALPFLLGACIATAAAFWYFIERPSHRLASRLFRPQRREA